MIHTNVRFIFVIALSILTAGCLLARHKTLEPPSEFPESLGDAAYSLFAKDALQAIEAAHAIGMDAPDNG